MGIRLARSSLIVAGLWVLACGGRVVPLGLDGAEDGLNSPGTPSKVPPSSPRDGASASSPPAISGEGSQNDAADSSSLPASAGEPSQGDGAASPCPMVSQPPCPQPPLMTPDFDFVDDAGEQCSVTFGNVGHYGAATCTAEWTETCGGKSYDVICRCPQGTCGCVGSTMSVVNFPGCPYCPGEVAVNGLWGNGINPSEAFALCGFPH